MRWCIEERKKGREKSRIYKFQSVGCSSNEDVVHFVKTINQKINNILVRHWTRGVEKKKKEKSQKFSTILMNFTCHVYKLNEDYSLTIVNN